MNYVYASIKAEIQNLTIFIDDCKRRIQANPEREAEIKKQYRYYRTALTQFKTALQVLKEANKRN